MVEVINNQVISSKTHSHANERSSFRGECFNCGHRGHYAARCPDKQEVRINQIDAAKLITISGKISKEASSIMLDSGAAMSLFTAKLIEQKYYTCRWMKVCGAVGQKFLPTAIRGVGVRVWRVGYIRGVVSI